MKTTTIDSCAISECAFNNNGCSAVAVTIAGKANDASCGTFIALNEHGGLPVAHATIGACQRVECVHNHQLLCDAAAIDVNAKADCSLYRVA
ncbi:DUF1540 domain-containing protein [Arcanobacterium sp. S3PF19]|jgi:membrane-bound ClpP family serine protease|uniref:DUF1540 domain-containing protein n=1 Tax=Arcanobacterium sp. S3PF19 TaxID=1219585 RepID=UPI00050EC424|nr:DUF1540 domain-containing protein [Arcanobacterium sp. S3PF19]KGF05527.1 hypothetical protein HMPREF1631_07030 [Arcanobacterium sp. S3PF19]